MTTRPTPRAASLAIAVAALFGVFVLPWFVPVRGAPMLSDSYMLGFANTAATLSLWVACLLLVWVAARTTAASVETPLWSVKVPGDKRRLRLVAIVLTVAALGIAAVLARITAGVAYGETAFFLDRMAQLAAGYRPLSDFSYGYALGGLYGPLWLWRLFRSHGLSPLEAYYVVYGLFDLCSWAMLYALVSRLALSDRRRALLFVCLGAVCVVNVTAGIQYTLVRYLTPPVALLALHLATTRAGRRVRPYAAGLTALGGLLAVLVFSTPEMELATLVALLVYFVALARTERQVAALAVLTLGVALVPLAMLSRGYFGLLFSFAGGAYNLPVLPGPPALVYVLAALIVAMFLPATLRGSPAAERPLTLSLVVLAALLAPAAFGRADSGHVLFNGLLMFLLAAAFLGRHRQRLFAPFVVVVLVVFATAAFVGITQLEGPALLRAVASSGSLSDGQFRALGSVVAWSPGKASPAQARYVTPKSTTSLAALDGYRLVAAPLGFNGADYDLSFALAAQHRLALDPITGTGFSLADLSRDLALLPKADCLLLPLADVSQVRQADPANTPKAGWLPGRGEHSYGALTLFPLPFYERNPQPNLGGAFSAYIHGHYRLVGSWGNYAVYVPARS
jgi:hypothetical protein